MLTKTKKKRFEYLGVKELSMAAERILKQLHQGQSKNTVSDFPNERTIRFYLSEGLLPTSKKKRGQSTVFGYLHLVSLLVIKKLQSEGLPISVIKSLIPGKSVSELERLLGERILVFTDQDAFNSFIETPGKEDGEDVIVLSDSRAREDYLRGLRKKGGPTANLENLLFKHHEEDIETVFSPRNVLHSPNKDPKKDQKGDDFETGSAEPTTVQDWRRTKIAEGVEIHTARLYRLPESELEQQSLFHSIEKALRSLA